MKTKLSVALFLSLLVFATCKKDKECVKGNGDFVQETRFPEAFNSVKIYNDANLYFAPGTESRIDLFAESNINPLIKTDVSQGVLTISVNDDECYTATVAPEITLSSPDCNEFYMNGSGKLEAHGINSDYFKIAVTGSGPVNSSLGVNELDLISEGSGNINLAGYARECNITLLASGNVYARNLESATCVVVSEGSGNITVNVTVSLSVIIKGSGNVYYSGNPPVIEEIITGSGLLIKED
ncbi:MAG: hypothetical protein DRI72_02400 [Bacteroidetes bacterium]|nr:MAG: hypothetical protein DRI72_02400 [Bacteroidota bacterium]